MPNVMVRLFATSLTAIPGKLYVDNGPEYTVSIVACQFPDGASTSAIIARLFATVLAVSAMPLEVAVIAAPTGAVVDVVRAKFAAIGFATAE